MTNLTRTRGDKVCQLHPLNLFEREAEAVESGARWWAIYTMSRQEKSLARDLFDIGLRYFLPLVESTKEYRRNRVSHQVPLFPGYLFLCGSDEDRVRALSTNRISRILDVHDAGGLISDLSRLHRLIETGAPLTPENQITGGDFVRIKAGPLAGIEGVVLRRRGETRLLVSVHFLQQGASVAVDAHMLEPIENCR